ncbi:hypothetical protein HQ865_05085 [Mucilaginibacter mali]|uniref:DUF4846 domain-containing protein n=1 Tax=Mucilaginibacter mali TaxID=2740462 RepID=A0A7D4QIL8_9SPHI|nr:DUF4846 domain-containing protein [Mucilaginibacter mali]QKJ29150.1 hypothetical protein HQ865_05085 [Mucilaginibacter mali]
MKTLTIFLLAFFVSASIPADDVNTRFKVPAGYGIITNIGFGKWLGQLSLKPAGTHTQTYKGDIARTDAYTAAVIDMSVGKQDLQQCADAVMRLRAEYLFHQKRYDAIAFNFTSGFRCDYVHYANGYRYSRDKWVKTATKDYSYAAFMRYMNLVFSYAGTLSLEKELIKVNNEKDLRAGDVFIHGGSPGHCFIVLAVAENVAHERKFLMAQSFMPAQNIQVLQADGNPWFSMAQTARIPYGELVDLKYLRRFKD